MSADEHHPGEHPGDHPREQDGDRAGVEDVGSLAEEAAKLFGVVAGWAQQHDTHVPPPRAPGEDGPTAGSPDCEWCPVCRTAQWVRGTSPEVRAHLGTAAASLAQAAAALLTGEAGGSGRGGDHARDRGGAGRTGAVQHIDLDTDLDTDPDTDLDTDLDTDAPPGNPR